MDLKEKRTPENDQILFTVQNNTPKLMPVELSMNIDDTSFTPFKTVYKDSIRRHIQPHSYRDFKKSECEILAWMLNAYSKSEDQPLNSLTIIFISFNLTGEAFTNTYDQIVSKAYGSGCITFPFGRTFIVNEDRYMVSRENGEEHEVVSFRIER